MTPARPRRPPEECVGGVISRRCEGKCESTSASRTMCVGNRCMLACTDTSSLRAVQGRHGAARVRAAAARRKPASTMATLCWCARPSTSRCASASAAVRQRVRGGRHTHVPTAHAARGRRLRCVPRRRCKPLLCSAPVKVTPTRTAPPSTARRYAVRPGLLLRHRAQPTQICGTMKGEDSPARPGELQDNAATFQEGPICCSATCA